MLIDRMSLPSNALSAAHIGLAVQDEKSTGEWDVKDALPKTEPQDRARDHQGEEADKPATGHHRGDAAAAGAREL